MPNHTDNFLTITLPTTHVDAVKKLLTNAKNQFSYEGLVPMPDLIRNSGSGFRDFDGVKVKSWYENRDTGEIRPFTEDETRQLEKLGAESWHDWSYENWGVKWDAYSGGNDPIELIVDAVGEDTTEIEVGFLSPWGPPEAWFNALKEALSKIDTSITATLQYRLEDDPHYPHEL